MVVPENEPHKYPAIAALEWDALIKMCKKIRIAHNLKAVLKLPEANDTRRSSELRLVRRVLELLELNELVLVGENAQLRPGNETIAKMKLLVELLNPIAIFTDRCQSDTATLATVVERRWAVKSIKI